MKAITIALLSWFAVSQLAGGSEAGTNFFAKSHSQCYTNGQKEWEVQVVTPGTGRVVHWREDGSTNSIHEFRDYAYNGSLWSWDRGSHLISEEHWKNGERHGTSTFWRSDGRKWLEEQWADGKLLAKHWWDEAGTKHEGDPPIE